MPMAERLSPAAGRPEIVPAARLAGSDFALKGGPGPGSSHPARAGPPPGARRTGGGRIKVTGPPPTPEEVIQRRRRRCADGQAIAAFFVKLAAIAALLAALLGVAFGITPMADNDMAPRISAGDLLLYYRLADHWSAGDVVVFRKDGRQYVGRIVARGGDTVEVTDQATLVVNGSTVLESDIYYDTPPYDGGPSYPLTLAGDELFVLCDYREGARDSRAFGPVREGEVEGKVITVVRRSNL